MTRRQTIPSCPHQQPDGLVNLPLTQREHDVFSQLVDGQSNGMIARLLAISRRTVEAHRARIFRKLHVRNAVELAWLASRTPCLRSICPSTPSAIGSLPGTTASGINHAPCKQQSGRLKAPDVYAREIVNRLPTVQGRSGQLVDGIDIGLTTEAVLEAGGDVVEEYDPQDIVVHKTECPACCAR